MTAKEYLAAREDALIVRLLELDERGGEAEYEACRQELAEVQAMLASVERTR